jgi:hypothetical protein
MRLADTHVHRPSRFCSFASTGNRAGMVILLAIDGMLCQLDEGVTKARDVTRVGVEGNVDVIFLS